MAEQMGRNPQGDFSGLDFGNGMTVASKMESIRGVRYQLRCRCGATGQTVSQQELAAGVTPTCSNSGCGKTSTETRRTAQFGSEDRFRGSVRARSEARREQETLAALEAEEKNV